MSYLSQEQQVCHTMSFAVGDAGTDEYMNMVRSVMGGQTDNEQERNKKSIKNFDFLILAGNQRIMRSSNQISEYDERIPNYNSRFDLYGSRINFTYNNGIIKEIFRLGVPASISMIVISMGILLFNRILGSSHAVAAYQTAGRIEHLFFFVLKFFWQRLIDKQKLL